MRLMRALVSDYSREGDVVADPCCGAGSTLLAAQDIGRRFWGCDLSEDHARMTIDRLAGAGGRDEELPLFGGAI